MTVKWELVYKWATDEQRNIVDQVVGALENCDAKLTASEQAREQAERDIAALREALEAAGWWIVANAGPQDWWPESWRVERTELLDRIYQLALKDTDEAEIRAEPVLPAPNPNIVARLDGKK